MICNQFQISPYAIKLMRCLFPAINECLYFYLHTKDMDIESMPPCAWRDIFGPRLTLRSPRMS